MIDFHGLLCHASLQSRTEGSLRHELWPCIEVSQETIRLGRKHLGDLVMFSNVRRTRPVFITLLSKYDNITKRPVQKGFSFRGILRAIHFCIYMRTKLEMTKLPLCIARWGLLTITRTLTSKNALGAVD